MLLTSIKFKSEQKHGTLYLVDDQEAGNDSFDNLGVCVEARQLDKKKQNHIKSN
jgi:hypothetical protein